MFVHGAYSRLAYLLFCSDSFTSLAYIKRQIQEGNIGILFFVLERDGLGSYVYLAMGFRPTFCFYL